MIREFKLVPFDPSWVTQEKLDIKAIYRRPRYIRGDFDEIIRATDNGLPAWDITTPLPVRRHNDHIRKGFEYVTLADRDSLGQAAKGLRAKQFDPADYDQHPEFGPWNPKLYMATVAASDKVAYDGLEQLVRELGSDAVLAVRRTAEPAFELPEQLRGIVPGGGKVGGAPRAARETSGAAAPAKAAKDTKGSRARAGAAKGKGAAATETLQP